MEELRKLIASLAAETLPNSISPAEMAEILSRMADKMEQFPNIFDGDTVNDIVQRGDIGDAFYVDGKPVDPKAGDILYSARGDYGTWGIITDMHYDASWMYITFVWEGSINTIMLTSAGEAARYVNRYAVPTIYDAESVLSAVVSGNMQDYFVIKDDNNSGEKYFKDWKVGDLIGAGGIIVSNIISGSTRTMQYIYNGQLTTITCSASSPSKISSINTASIGAPTDAANPAGSIYARIAANKQAIGNSTDAAKEDGSLYARITALNFKFKWVVNNGQLRIITNMPIPEGYKLYRMYRSNNRVRNMLDGEKCYRIRNYRWCCPYNVWDEDSKNLPIELRLSRYDAVTKEYIYDSQYAAIDFVKLFIRLEEDRVRVKDRSKRGNEKEMTKYTGAYKGIILRYGIAFFKNIGETENLVRVSDMKKIGIYMFNWRMLSNGEELPLSDITSTAKLNTYTAYVTT